MRCLLPGVRRVQVVAKGPGADADADLLALEEHGQAVGGSAAGAFVADTTMATRLLAAQVGVAPPRPR